MRVKVYWIMGLCLLYFVQLNSRAAEKEQDHRIQSAIQSLDAEFDESFLWWAEVYDPESGGCFYALSAKEAADADSRFGPDIESTSKLVRVLEWTGILEESPAVFKNGVIRYMQTRQDPESGFFTDSRHREIYTPNTLQRAAGMAANALSSVGGSPLYPMPLERIGENPEAAKQYAFLESPGTLRQWLENLPWESRVWTVGGRLRAMSEVFQDLPEPKRGEFLRDIEQFVRARQKENGFFGTEKDDWTSKLSGSYKIAAFFNQNGLDVPRANELADTVLHHLYQSDYRNSIVLYNTANVLNILHRRGADFDLEQRLKIVEKCTEILHGMRAPDGGFVTHLDFTSPESNGRLLAKDVVESNSNATGLAHKTRMLLIELLTGESAPHPHARSGDLLKGLSAGSPQK